MTFPDQKSRLALAARVNEAEGVGILAAVGMVNHACAFGPASPHWDSVLPHVRAWMNELLRVLRPVMEGLSQAITDEVRQGLRQHEQGRRMVARHPDLAALDEFFDRMYGNP